MTRNPDGNHALLKINGIRIDCFVLIFTLLAIIAVPRQGRADSAETLPHILMVTVPGLTPDSPALYKAIRAQLSASPLTLDRIEMTAEQGFATDAPGSAAALAFTHHASVVFWVEDKATCEMFFYIPDREGGRINRRVLNLDFRSRSSRYEVIGIAVASMVEELMVSHRIGPSPTTTPKPTSPPQQQPDIEETRKWAEIFGLYAGTYFSSSLAAHGMKLGVGVAPIDRLVIGVSYTQNFPLTFEDKMLQFTVISRNVEVACAGRLSLNPVDIRLGVAWSIDIRSYSTVSLSDDVSAARDGFKGVNSVIPFVSIGWIFKERIGIIGRLGANLAVNESIYQVQHGEERVDAVVPFVAKLSYQLGLIVQL